MSTSELSKLEHNNYNYMGYIKEADESDIKSIENFVGHAIRQEYENGTKMTPEKKRRLILICIIAVGIIAGTVCLIVGGEKFKPLPYLSIPCYVTSGGTIIYGLVSYKPDLDSPKERMKVQKNICHMVRTQRVSLQELLKKHTSVQIIGFALLDEARFNPNGVNGLVIDKREKAMLYAKFDKLVCALDRTNQKVTDDRQTIIAAFARDTVHESNVYNQKYSAARSRQFNGALNSSMGSTLTSQSLKGRRRDRSYFGAALGMGMSVGGEMEKSAGIRDEADALAEYNANTLKPRAARDALLKNVSTAEQAVYSVLNRELYNLVVLQ